MCWQLPHCCLLPKPFLWISESYTCKLHSSKWNTQSLLLSLCPLSPRVFPVWEKGVFQVKKLKVILNFTPCFTLSILSASSIESIRFSASSLSHPCPGPRFFWLKHPPSHSFSTQQIDFFVKYKSDCVTLLLNCCPRIPIALGGNVTELRWPTWPCITWPGAVYNLYHLLPQHFLLVWAGPISLFSFYLLHLSSFCPFQGLCTFQEWFSPGFAQPAPLPTSCLNLGGAPQISLPWPPYRTRVPGFGLHLGPLSVSFTPVMQLTI